jgi:hypothetical protein
MSVEELKAGEQGSSKHAFVIRIGLEIIAGVLYSQVASVAGGPHDLELVALESALPQEKWSRA